MSKKSKADHGPGTPALNRPNPAPAAEAPPDRAPAANGAAPAPMTAAELRAQELAECQAVINRALERYQAQLVTQRIETVGPNGEPRVQYNTTIISR